MEQVTVIGLGEMGGALAAALVRAGHRVTVWNRTAARADALIAAGARLASDPETAIAASPITIVCVSDYTATSAILTSDAAPAALGGRTLVQLSSGTPRQAREMSAWAAETGARYLDGKIFAWPRQIGGPEAAMFLAGSAAVFEEAKPVLKSLAGGLTHLGEEPGIAAAYFSAGLAYLAGHWIGFAHGAHIAEAEGIDVNALGEMLGGFAPVLGEDLRHMGRVVAQGAFAEPESALKTAGNDIARLIDQAADAGISDAFPRFAAGLFQEAIRAGHGAEEHVAIIRTMRDQGPRQPAP